jgi:putative ABC transport system substrate-binding protein
MGIVKSLRHPGANATGLSAEAVGIQAKRLQLLREVFPAALRVAVLHDALNVAGTSMLSALKKASTALDLKLLVVGASSADGLASAFIALRAQPPDVLYVVESPLTLIQRTPIVEFANGQHLPAVYGFREFAEVGGLMSYSFSLTEHYNGAATFIDKILKGARPAELPVEQPTRFELVLNLKTAKAQGISFPPAVLLRADRVIE